MGLWRVSEQTQDNCLKGSERLIFRNLQTKLKTLFTNRLSAMTLVSPSLTDGRQKLSTIERDQRSTIKDQRKDQRSKAATLRREVEQVEQQMTAGPHTRARDPSPTPPPPLAQSIPRERERGRVRRGAPRLAGQIVDLQV